MKQIEIVAAIIFCSDRILCVQRNSDTYPYISMKYEFPGGKIDTGETKEAALKRELKEELNIDIEIFSEYMTVSHTYPDFYLTMHTYTCNCEDTSVALSVHIDHKWLTKDRLGELDWAAADIPVIKRLALR
ncbi:MAG: (deoxy)nucleoside triphosphate pyrophosphohydrolase [Nitrospira sp.]|nr:(deoxy)nucleoside triphosphate pyrophosphohydrolase [Nitrospira sp.]